MKNGHHFFATMNYIHHNPVVHGYVNRWQEWPWSSATQYLDQVGRDHAEALWRKYDISSYGEKWDRHPDVPPRQRKTAR